MSDNNLHFNHFVNYYSQNYWLYQATQIDSLRYPSIQLPSKIIKINHSDFKHSLEEVKEIDEATNETIDDEIIDKIINVIDDEEDSSCITELWTYSDINKLLDILAVNWELYKNNKTKFCTNAKRGKQVKAKLFNLNRTRYTNDKKEVTGKATST
ncbi:unnamed protein product [Rhizophagus irregularis]|nr:unnamed protein product [Rhizophagus irregularis]